MTRRRHPITRPSQHERGHTLVELMIALVLGLVLVGAVFVVFLGSRMSFSTSDNLSRMQDSARIAFAMMSREIREASGTGCGNGGRADNGIARRNRSVLNAAQSEAKTDNTILTFSCGLLPQIGVVHFDADAPSISRCYKNSARV